MKRKLLAAAAALLLMIPSLTACAPNTLMIYTDLGKGDVEKLIAPFVEKSDVQVQIQTFGSADSLLDAVSPGGRGQYSGRDEAGPSPTPNPNPPDVILTQDMTVMAQLAGRDALLSYMSPSVASPAIPYGASGSGYWYGFGGKGWVIAWNTDLVKTAPESYADLADDAYPMKSVVIPNPQQFYFYPLSIYTLMGADYALNIFQTLMLNGADFNASPDNAIKKVTSGEAQLAITTYALAKQAKDSGAPVDFVFPDQGQTDMGTYVEFYSVAICSAARNPKAAKRLDDWLLSAEAEKRSVELGMSDVSLRDVGGGAPIVKPLVVSPEEVLANAQAASEALGRLSRGN